jgi:surface protein
MKISGKYQINGLDINKLFIKFLYNNNMTYLSENIINNLNMSQFQDMFKGCNSLTSLDISNWNVSSLTTVSGNKINIFYNDTIEDETIKRKEKMVSRLNKLKKIKRKLKRKKILKMFYLDRLIKK